MFSGTSVLYGTVRKYLFLALLAMMLPAAYGVDVMVTNGFSENGKTYDEETLLDLRALDGTRAVASVATLTSCVISSAVVTITGWLDEAPDTFATSLYMRLQELTITGARAFINVNLVPPNAYIHLNKVNANKRNHVCIGLTSSWQFNSTVLIEDSELRQTSNVYALAMNAVGGRPNELSDGSLLYMRNTKISKTSGMSIFRGAFTLKREAAVVFETVQCIDCQRAAVLLEGKLVIEDHSAFIVSDGLSQDGTQGGAIVPFLSATSIEVDETSIFTFVDINTANNFQSSDSPAMVLDSIDGNGVIVFCRWRMQKSGLTRKQPLDNTNFWVSARSTATTDLTAAQLRHNHNFNVNVANVYNWDGTNAQGTCVPVGHNIPGRARYIRPSSTQLCVGVCLSNTRAPACRVIPRTRCNVDNCELCYRITRTKCLLCTPHTNNENDDQICRCPANLENCQTCPSESTCTRCVDGFHLTSGGLPCVMCNASVPECVQCSGPNACQQCAPHYNVSEDKTKCHSCDIENCVHCDGNDICDQCVPYYNVSDIGSPNNRCISCKVPNCLFCKEDDKCDTCAADYTKPEGKTTCAHCPIEHCERCDVDGICAKCPDKHTPVDGEHCYPCTMPGCLKCDGDEQCADCDDKHTLVNKKCVACDIPNCKSCLTDGVCDECEPKHTLHNEGVVSECISCNVNDCLLCNATDSCAMCSDGHLITDKRKCIRCDVHISNCAVCDPSGFCQECKSAYKLSRDKMQCLSCPMAGCQRCDTADVCSLCVEPTLAVSLGGGECIPCDIGNCTHCSSSGKCATCECGMVPNEKSSECVSCVAANCRNCEAPGDGTQCEQCTEGYKVSGGSCQKVVLPPWLVFVIVVICTVATVVIAVICGWYYCRWQANRKMMEVAAEERRRNRMRRPNTPQSHLLLTMLDLGDLEAAASGVRDTTLTMKL